MLALGIDPGYSNLGLGFLQFDTQKASAHIVNLTRWGNKKHKISVDDISFIVSRFIHQYWDLLSKVSLLFLERQPPIGHKTVLLFATHIEASIRIAFPRCEIFKVDPKATRKAWGTNVKHEKGATEKQKYSSNKKASTRYNENVFSPEEMQRAQSVFRWSDKSAFKVDAIEAMQLCMYGVQNIEEIRSKQSGLVIRHPFERLVMKSTAFCPKKQEPENKKADKKKSPARKKSKT